ERGPSAPRPGCAVSLYQSTGSTVSWHPGSGDLGGYEELVGAFKNGGRTWRPQGKPYEVKGHDWPSRAQGKAIPYGVYEFPGDRAGVNVGINHDTAEFAVESTRRWWRLDGRQRYGSARRLLICADGGGSKASRSRAWRANRLELAEEIGVPITVSAYPPGTSQ